MNPARTARLLKALMLALPLLRVAPVSAAERSIYNGDWVPDNENYQPGPGDIWKESEAEAPPYPGDTDLIPVPPNPSDTIKVYVDAKSVSRPPDGTLRFVLVVVSSGGARNVFYDGIRCDTHEYKIFATGTDDKLMVPMRGAQWRLVPRFPTNAYVENLYKNYVCEVSLRSRTPDAFLHKLKYGN
jgi:hypothetical protein